MTATHPLQQEGLQLSSVHTCNHPEKLSEQHIPLTWFSEQIPTNKTTAIQYTFKDHTAIKVIQLVPFHSTVMTLCPFHDSRCQGILRSGLYSSNDKQFSYHQMAGITREAHHSVHTKPDSSQPAVSNSRELESTWQTASSNEFLSWLSYYMIAEPNRWLKTVSAKDHMPQACWDKLRKMITSKIVLVCTVQLEA